MPPPEAKFHFSYSMTLVNYSGPFSACLYIAVTKQNVAHCTKTFENTIALENSNLEIKAVFCPICNHKSAKYIYIHLDHYNLFRELIVEC